MKTTVKKATATTARGTQINITVTATRGFEMVDVELFNDGYNSTVKKAQVTSKNKVTLEFAGKTLLGHITTLKPSPTTPTFFGYFLANDNKTVMPFDKDVYQAIENCEKEAVAEAELDEEYVAYLTRKAENEKAEADYYKHANAVKNMMTLNGRTY